MRGVCNLSKHLLGFTKDTNYASYQTKTPFLCYIKRKRTHFAHFCATKRN